MQETELFGRRIARDDVAMERALGQNRSRAEAGSVRFHHRVVPCEDFLVPRAGPCRPTKRPEHGNHLSRPDPLAVSPPSAKPRERDPHQEQAMFSPTG